MSKQITLQDFERIFHALFLQSEHTQLVDGRMLGLDEPVYRPKNNSTPAQIIYAHGFFQSALHEVAHWCHAGPKRRQYVDYGYWYAGDSRNAAQQQAFEKVELIPQAYEYLLTQVCGLKFQVSLDNFNPYVTLDRVGFLREVRQYAFSISKVSPRLMLLLEKINEHYSI